ncbi:FAD-binding domain-containing protein [Parathielavia appendiculata]|uniref:FAD-binding domain-containing protein n=1 Tax=Parathielavia appendiculata TaxID=2587402 RepID=A0AAN6TSY4_9PEZI|nr:FAD-binding domain-containing protein [Parathielavia appendiculata]
MLSVRIAPLLPLFLWAVSSVSADTCSEVRDNTDIEVSSPLQLAYIDEQTDYWSASCSALKPSCIIFPRSAAEVAAVLRVLNTNNEKFAVKSGGHSPNNYYASIDGGPLISTQRMDHVLLDPTTGVIDVGPGNRLDEVAKKLHGTGWTFVGGRIGNTGVGGLMLGGGLSYMSAQYGWSASSAISYEVVLANGTIVTASDTSHPDLFVALKGGGNNFGVVTSYKLQAHPQGQIYGGNLIFLRTPDLDAKILRAVRDFTEYNTDDKAAIIVTAERTTVNLVDSWILFLFYDGPESAVPPGTFANFTSLQPLLANTVRTRTYADMMAESNWVVLKGLQVQIGTESVPLPAAVDADEVLVEGIHAHWRNVTDSALLVPGMVASVAYMPFPKRIAQAARERGQDLLDVDPDADRLIVELDYIFLSPTDYSKMEGKMVESYSGIRERVVEWQAEGKLRNVYLPLFMNYGFYRQDYWGRLKAASRQLAREVAERVDPAGLFRTRTGGWKP